MVPPPWLYDAFMLPLGWLGLDRLRGEVAAGARGRTLEVGAGTGLALTGYGAEAQPLVAIDLDEAGLRRARARNGRALLVKASVEALPFCDAAFDSVVSSLVFCSVQRPRVGLTELRRVLRPSGQLRMLEHVRPKGWFLGALASLLTPLWRRVAGNCHLDRRTQDDLRATGFAETEWRRSLRGAGLVTSARPCALPAPEVAAEEPDLEESSDQAEPVIVPIDGTLDLHTVRPSEAAAMVLEYLEACAERGILEVRVVHGKGTGALRRTVHAALARSPLVASFRTADETAGGWGATLITLKGGS